jgi:hypothetical protein
MPAQHRYWYVPIGHEQSGWQTSPARFFSDRTWGMGCALRGVQHGRANVHVREVDMAGQCRRCRSPYAIGIVRSNIDLGVQSQRKRPFGFHQKFAEKALRASRDRSALVLISRVRGSRNPVGLVLRLHEQEEPQPSWTKFGFSAARSTLRCGVPIVNVFTACQELIV